MHRTTAHSAVRWGNQEEACLARRVVVAEGIEGEDDLGDNWVRVRVGTSGVWALCRRRRGFLPGAGDDGGALHMSHKERSARAVSTYFTSSDIAAGSVVVPR